MMGRTLIIGPDSFFTAGLEETAPPLDVQAMTSRRQSEMALFTVAFREQVRARVLELARADAHIVAGAAVGSLALGGGDRWSDLDLTFGVAEGNPLSAVLEEWTETLLREFEAVHLFDLPSGPSIYRVFLLPGCLQFDLSFTPAAQFGATGPKFELLFGRAVTKPFAPTPPAQELFGYAVHHALRARFCIERGKLWQAEYWLSSLRNYGLSLACHARGLPVSHARGYDQLPAEVLDPFKGALAASVERGELLRALGAAIEALLMQTGEVRELAAQLEPALRGLTKPWEMGSE